jgi:hypothetical protein
MQIVFNVAFASLAAFGAFVILSNVRLGIRQIQHVRAARKALIRMQIVHYKVIQPAHGFEIANRPGVSRL